MAAYEDIPEDFWEILENRVLMMPTGMAIAVGGSSEPLDKTDIMREISERSAIGQTFAKRELIFVRSLAKLAARSRT